MNKNIKQSSTSNKVQSAITSISFPESLERLRAMGIKWRKSINADWITDMDVLLNYPSVYGDVTWIAPKWLTEGDLLFFYHTKTATNKIRKLYSLTNKMLHGSLATLESISTEDLNKLIQILQRSLNIANEYSGTIFGFAEVSGRPKRIFDEDKHFMGTIYAPLGNVYIFKNPLKSKDFEDVVEIGQNTTTPLYAEKFEMLKERLGINNLLPRILKNATLLVLGSITSIIIIGLKYPAIKKLDL